jgi:8-oxo-dGTP pyrophosphatase MutT (NUDIX family)
MTNLIQDLRKRLQEPLPGIAAQMKMISHRLAISTDKVSHFKIPETHKKASVLALLYLKGNVWYTALMQRPESPYPHSRQISFPGGGVEEFDINTQDTALRETEEEFGIPKNTIEVLGQLTDLYIPVSNYLVHPFVGYLSAPPLFIPDSSEVEEILEIPIAHLLDIQNRKIKTIATHSGTLPDVPYFDLNQKVVWGATAMMLSEFATVLEELDSVKIS